MAGEAKRREIKKINARRALPSVQRSAKSRQSRRTLLLFNSRLQGRIILTSKPSSARASERQRKTFQTGYRFGLTATKAIKLGKLRRVLHARQRRSSWQGLAGGLHPAVSIRPLIPSISLHRMRWTTAQELAISLDLFPFSPQRATNESRS